MYDKSTHGTIAFAWNCCQMLFYISPWTNLHMQLIKLVCWIQLQCVYLVS